MSEDLFDEPAGYIPLAARMRPTQLEEYLGQEHLLGPDKPLYKAISSGAIHSMIFWGPPGTGKTSLAQLIAQTTDSHFQSISAVLGGVKEIRAAIEEAQLQRQQYGRKSILFIDEVHRFNKAQQDAFLPYVENGTIIFIGATTENPSFELNNALLSRARVYVLKPLDTGSITAILEQAIHSAKSGLADRNISVDDDGIMKIARTADGDARRALNILEIAADLAVPDSTGFHINSQVLDEVLQGDRRRFDKGGDIFYEQISALHKSVRGSSPDAALYWYARMLDGGCDALYIARRVVRMASEDIGNADPRGLQLALNAWDTQERLGSPEGELAIAQAISYLAAAPKSNAVYKAWNKVRADVEKLPSYEVPMHLRNAPTSLMKDLEYGGDYRYAHDEEQSYAAGENYFPEELKDSNYYQPTDNGLEAKIKQKLDHLHQLDKMASQRRYKAD
jgi:putative ATPase